MLEAPISVEIEKYAQLSINPLSPSFYVICPYVIHAFGMLNACLTRQTDEIYSISSCNSEKSIKYPRDYAYDIVEPCLLAIRFNNLSCSEYELK